MVNRATQGLEHYHIRDLPALLRPHDTLVINDTKVVPARLVGRRAASGGRWEGLFLSADEHGNWRLMCKARGRLAPGEHIILVNERQQDAFDLRLLIKEPEGTWIAKPETAGRPLELLADVGRSAAASLYSRRRDDRGRSAALSDRVCASTGAVAAPTAGLHFTEELLARLTGMGVNVAARSRCTSAPTRFAP